MSVIKPGREKKVEAEKREICGILRKSSGAGVIEKCPHTATPTWE